MKAARMKAGQIEKGQIEKGRIDAGRVGIAEFSAFALKMVSEQVPLG
jgi:hypothetical protein